MKTSLVEAFENNEVNLSKLQYEKTYGSIA